MAKLKREGVTTERQPRKKLSARKLYLGDHVSRTSYMKVVGVVPSQNKVIVQNTDGLKWEIDARVVEKECFSADQYSKTVDVTRTELVNIFKNAGDAVFTVNFITQDKRDRKLIGYLLNTENEFGRSNVIDLEEKNNYNTRQVDHRTMYELILKNTRYVVKGKAS